MTWFQPIKIFTLSLKSVWIPLNSTFDANAWIKMIWVRGEGKPEDVDPSTPLIYDGKTLHQSVAFCTKKLETTFEKDVKYVPFKSDLTHVTRFLDADFFRFKEPEQRTQITVDFSESPSSKWTPELLSKVDRFILEVRGGKSEDVKILFDAVKKSTVSEVHLIGFDESVSLEEGMSALKGSTNIKSFLYSDDDFTPNQILIDALIDLTANLPSLETLTLRLGQKLYSPLVVPLLQAIANLKIKELLLHEIPRDADLDFVPFLAEIAAEKLELCFQHYFDVKDSTFNSLVNGLKTSKLPKLEISVLPLSDEESKQLVGALVQMPNLVSFACNVGEPIVKHIVELVKKLKSLYIDVGFEAKNFNPDPLLDAAATSETLVTLSLNHTTPTNNTTESLARLFKNTKLRKLHCSCKNDNQLHDTGSFIDDIKQNTNLEYACIGIYDYRALLHKQTKEINGVFGKRNAKFCTS